MTTQQRTGTVVRMPTHGESLTEGPCSPPTTLTCHVDPQTRPRPPVVVRFQRSRAMPSGRASRVSLSGLLWK